MTVTSLELREQRWLPLGCLVVGTVAHCYGALMTLIATPHGKNIYIKTAMPGWWGFASGSCWFIGALVLGTAFAMLVGRDRNLIPRHITLVIAILASTSFVSSLIALDRLHALKTIDIEDFSKIFGGDTVPLELTAAPLVVIGALALITFGAWRLWWVAHTTRVRTLRELAEVNSDLAKDAGDIVPAPAEPDIRL